jgi:hypothetical protein
MRNSSRFDASKQNGKRRSAEVQRYWQVLTFFGELLEFVILMRSMSDEQYAFKDRDGAPPRRVRRHLLRVRLP